MTAAATESVRHSREIEPGGFGRRFLFGVLSAKWKRPRKTRGLAEKADLFELGSFFWGQGVYAMVQSRDRPDHFHVLPVVGKLLAAIQTCDIGASKRGCYIPA